MRERAHDLIALYSQSDWLSTHANMTLSSQASVSKAREDKQKSRGHIYVNDFEDMAGLVNFIQTERFWPPFLNNVHRQHPYWHREFVQSVHTTIVVFCCLSSVFQVFRITETNTNMIRASTTWAESTGVSLSLFIYK